MTDEDPAAPERRGGTPGLQPWQGWVLLVCATLIIAGLFTLFAPH